MTVAWAYVDGCLCTRCADHHAATCGQCRKVLAAVLEARDDVQTDEIPVVCPEGWHVAAGHEDDAHPDDVSPRARELEPVTLAHFDGMPLVVERVLR